MTQIKLCGMSRPCDIKKANELKPDYIGFIFFEKSHRNITEEHAAALKKMLDPAIKAVGVFVDETIETIARIADAGTIDIIQLHGHENEDYIRSLREITDKPIFQAFRLKSPEDAALANASSADMILTDSGYGTGQVFDWNLLQLIHRPYFLAGGLNNDNILDALSQIQPYGIDVSSGIETDKLKDPAKMEAFVEKIRKEDKHD